MKVNPPPDNEPIATLKCVDWSAPGTTSLARWALVDAATGRLVTWWEDEPTPEQVEAARARYQAAAHDGNTGPLQVKPEG